MSLVNLLSDASFATPTRVHQELARPPRSYALQGPSLGLASRKEWWSWMPQMTEALTSCEIRLKCLHNRKWLCQRENTRLLSLMRQIGKTFALLHNNFFILFVCVYHGLALYGILCLWTVYFHLEWLDDLKSFKSGYSSFIF